MFLFRIIFFSLLCLCFSFAHPYYLSVADFKYNENEKALQGYVKIFTNDLESALKKSLKNPVDLINVKDTARTRQILLYYLHSHFTAMINEKPVEYELLGFEQEEESIFMYLEMKNCPLPKTAQFNNSVLYDYIKEQSNIVHLEVKAERKSLKVTNPQKVLKFSF